MVLRSALVARLKAQKKSENGPSKKGGRILQKADVSHEVAVPTRSSEFKSGPRARRASNRGTVRGRKETNAVVDRGTITDHEEGNGVRVKDVDGCETVADDGGSCEVIVDGGEDCEAGIDWGEDSEEDAGGGEGETDEVDEDQQFIDDTPNIKLKAVRRSIVEYFPRFLKEIIDTPEASAGHAAPTTTWISGIAAFIAYEKSKRKKRPMSENFIQPYFSQIRHYLHLKYERHGFECSMTLCKEISKAMTDTWVKEGLFLHKTKKKPKSALGRVPLVQAAQIISQAYQTGTNGSSSAEWRVVYQRILALLLYTATGARVNDIALSQNERHLHPDRFSKWKDLKIKAHTLVPRGAPVTIGNFNGLLTLENTKGKKDVVHDDVYRYLDPIPSHPNLCLLSTLLIYAVENSLVYGRTVYDVLRRALNHKDRLVEWVHPDWPIICKESDGTFLDLQEPATNQHVYKMMDRLAENANMKQFRIHDLRRGGAEEQGKVTDEQADGKGVETGFIRVTLNHTKAAELQGLTRQYAGGPGVDFHQLAVMNNSEQLPRRVTISKYSAIGTLLYSGN
ncbi:hypothetical protein TRICI_006113 [Trichomonascus ciferrii]|uniref:Uncharacterized protein n=1 Tax=Trichomonascus ciferrii TaxID=44093 RepID=A0A642UKN0_9ASCO|nr:hypothetical protein TRICI_006113 [Trichomonascus ciferrii]